jgi:hypothetical protein
LIIRASSIVGGKRLRVTQKCQRRKNAAACRWRSKSYRMRRFSCMAQALVALRAKRLAFATPLQIQRAKHVLHDLEAVEHDLASAGSEWTLAPEDALTLMLCRNPFIFCRLHCADRVTENSARSL